jgi:hypothetical protein
MQVHVCDVCKAQGKWTILLHGSRWRIWRYPRCGRIDVCETHDESMRQRRSWSWWDIQNWLKVGAPEHQLLPPTVRIVVDEKPASAGDRGL